MGLSLSELFTKARTDQDSGYLVATAVVDSAGSETGTVLTIVIVDYSKIAHLDTLVFTISNRSHTLTAITSGTPAAQQFLCVTDNNTTATNLRTAINAFDALTEDIVDGVCGGSAATVTFTMIVADPSDAGAFSGVEGASALTVALAEPVWANRITASSGGTRWALVGPDAVTVDAGRPALSFVMWFLERLYAAYVADTDLGSGCIDVHKKGRLNPRTNMLELTYTIKLSVDTTALIPTQVDRVSDHFSIDEL